MDSHSVARNFKAARRGYCCEECRGNCYVTGLQPVGSEFGVQGSGFGGVDQYCSRPGGRQSLGALIAVRWNLCCPGTIEAQLSICELFSDSNDGCRGLQPNVSIAVICRLLTPDFCILTPDTDTDTASDANRKICSINATAFGNPAASPGPCSHNGRGACRASGACRNGEAYFGSSGVNGCQHFCEPNPIRAGRRLRKISTSIKSRLRAIAYREMRYRLCS